jgi:D-alanyl-D-alanine carboxypeptidase
MSETFIAVVCLQLAEEDVLDLDDPITNWLPAQVYQQIPKPDRITVQELLNHTSGLPELNTEALQQAVIADPSHRWQAKELLSFGFASDQSPTQRSFFYSTANYLLLELILERATGNSLAQTLQERIFKPLGLKNTFVELSTKQPIVQGYQDWNRDGSLEDVTQPLINTGLGLGGTSLISNAPDLIRFMQTLFFEQTLLTSASRQKMLSLVATQDGGYGLGIMHMMTRWGEVWGQSSNTTGFSSAILYLPVHDLVLVVWTNSKNDKDNQSLELADHSLSIVFGNSAQRFNRINRTVAQIQGK